MSSDFLNVMYASEILFVIYCIDFIKRYVFVEILPAYRDDILRVSCPVW